MNVTRPVLSPLLVTQAQHPQGFTWYEQPSETGNYFGPVLAQANAIGSRQSISQPACACDDAEKSAPDLERLRAILASDSPPRSEYRGPAFFFPQKLPSPSDAELLTNLGEAPSEGPFSWMRDARDAIKPVVVVHADNGEVASICHSARSTSAAAEAGVKTLERFRGHGYGTAAVATWASAIRREGRVPLYSTEWENAASRALVARLNLLCYGEDLHIA